MSNDTFESRLNKALETLESGTGFDKTYDAVKRIARSIENSVNRQHGDNLKIQVEPGFQATMGQQFNVVIRVPSQGFRDGLFRVYIPSGGYPVHLDLYGESLIGCGDEPEMEEQILGFLSRPEMKERLRVMTDYAYPP